MESETSYHGYQERSGAHGENHPRIQLMSGKGIVVGGPLHSFKRAYRVPSSVAVKSKIMKGR